MSEQVPTWEQPTGQYRITAELVAEWADAKANGAMMLYHSAESAADHCKGVAAFVRMQEAKLEIHARRLKALERVAEAATNWLATLRARWTGSRDLGQAEAALETAVDEWAGKIVQPLPQPPDALEGE